MNARHDPAAAIPFRRKVVYALVPAVLLFGSVEVFLRAGHSLARNKWESNVFLRPHEIARWSEGRWLRQRRIETTLNNLGLRGPDVHPDTDQTRLLFVGDSITFGEGVRDEEAFPSVAERILPGRLPEARPRVINGGVPGYGIAEETALVKALLPRVRPAVVLLTFCVNDLFAVMEQQAPERYARYEEERFSPLFSLSATTRHLFLRYFVFLYVNGLSSPYINGIHPLQQDGPDVRRAWSEYFSALDFLAAFLRENRVEFGLVVFPDFSQVVTGIDTPEKQFRGYGEERGIPVLPLLETFRERRGEGIPLLIPDGHPNARAHEIIASAVVDWLAGDRGGPPPFPSLAGTRYR